MGAPGRHDFFIAHAGADRAAAEQLYDALIARAASVFLDTRSLAPDDPWDTAIPRALANAEVVLVLIGENTGVAFYLRDEIASAIDRSRRHAVDLEELGIEATADALLRLPKTKSTPRASAILTHAAETTPGEPALRAALERLLEQDAPDLTITSHQNDATTAIEAPADLIARLIDRLRANDENTQRFAEDAALAAVRAVDPAFTWRATDTAERRRAGSELIWVHLSDLHIGHGDAGHRANQEELLDRLL